MRRTGGRSQKAKTSGGGAAGGKPLAAVERRGPSPTSARLPSCRSSPPSPPLSSSRRKPGSMEAGREWQRADAGPPCPWIPACAGMTNGGERNITQRGGGRACTIAARSRRAVRPSSHRAAQHSARHRPLPRQPDPRRIALRPASQSPPTLVIPAQAGIHGGGTRMAARRRRSTVSMDPGLRRDDEWG